MRALTAAERLLQELGVTEPGEIDLEAIALTVGARVRFRPLDGCEARIIGNGDQAIITVNDRSSRRRRRFSLAHELGHWHHHRGRLLVCRASEIGANAQHVSALEKVADAYAADLLMPRYLFDPVARTHRRLTFQTVAAIVEAFDVSRPAAAIRLIETRHSPALLICHGPEGRRWFVRSPDVPSRWFPRTDLDTESFAFGVLFGQQPEDRMPRKIGADAWFDRQEADRYEVEEQTIRTADDEILTIILVTDEEMLEDWGSSARR